MGFPMDFCRFYYIFALSVSMPKDLSTNHLSFYLAGIPPHHRRTLKDFTRHSDYFTIATDVLKGYVNLFAFQEMRSKHSIFVAK